MLKLNEKQEKAAFEIPSNLLLSASPGSGKTRTLIARAEYKLESIPKGKTIALITYTNAATDEITARFTSHQKIFIGTIHRFCLEFILRPFSWIYNWSRPRVVTYDELKNFIETNPDFELGDSPLEVINLLKNNPDGTLDIDVEWEYETPIEVVAEKYFHYLNSINSLDFNGILYRSNKIISENKFVAVSLGNKFHEILVDEFQDTNTFQYNIFHSIYKLGLSTFFMVGDERQRIFRFAGAIDNAFSRATTDFSAHHELLDNVYRSSDKIVNSYRTLFDNHPRLINESEHKDLDVDIVFQEYVNATHDELLTYHVNDLVSNKGIPLSEIAVLSTRWRDSLRASKALRTSYNVVGLGALPHAVRNLNNSTFNLLRSLCQFNNRPSIRNLKTIKRAIELHALENDLILDENQFISIQNSLIQSIKNLNKENIIDKGLEQLAEVFSKTFGVPHSTFNDIIQRIDAEEAPFWNMDKYIKTLSGIDGITINTIHQAKGLEYDAVILDQMNENKIPHQKLIEKIGSSYRYENLTKRSIDDGRNLFYVALSRARKYVIILHHFKPSLFIPIIRD